MQSVQHISVNFQEILELIHDPVIIFDPITNKILEVNDSACLTYSIERERFLNLTINYLWVNRLREAEMFGALFEKGCVKDFETTYMCADGSQMDFIVNASLMESNGRKVVLTRRIAAFQFRRTKYKNLRTTIFREMCESFETSSNAV